MIINLVLNVIIDLMIGVFYFLPVVDTLPTMFGYDIDSTLITAMAILQRVTEVVWPLGIAFKGFLVLMGYYITKLTLKIFLGSRTPGN